MCKYIYIDRGCCRVTIWFYDFGEKLLGHDNPTFIHFLNLLYGSDMLSSCVPFIV